MRTNRVLPAVTATVLAFALTGCAGDEGGAEVPTAGGGTSKTAGGNGGSGKVADKDVIAQYVEGKRAWVTCMRENGFALNDPDEKGQIDYGTAEQRGALKGNPKYIPAQQKCAPLDPPMPEGYEKAVNGPIPPEQIRAAREHARCMQKNGAPDYPDPGPDGYGTDDNSGEPGWDHDSAGGKRATRLCAAVVGDPTPTGAPPAKG